MEEGMEKIENQEKTPREEIFSKAVRAGKRTYFFDVKATRRNELYLTITESKKRFGKEGKPFFEKHKVFLYREDFNKFTEGLNEVMHYIQNEQPEIREEKPKTTAKTEDAVTEDFTNVAFEDLGEKSE